MGKTILIGLLVFLTVIGLGSYISWYSQASLAKSSIENMLSKLNQQQKYITYDAVVTSGYPSNVFVSIVKPHFSGRVDLLVKDLQALSAHTPSQPLPPAADMPQWQEDVVLDGNIVFGVNALSDHYDMQIIGNWKEASSINGKTFSTVYQQNGTLSCTLKMERSGGVMEALWNFKTLARDGQSFLQDFREVDCNSPGNVLLNQASNVQLGSGGPMRFYLVNEPQGEVNKLRLYMKAADIEITPQGDDQLTEYFHTLSPNYPFPTVFSIYGKQNIDIDFSYNGQQDWQKPGSNLPVDIALMKFDLTNQVYNHHMNFHFNNTPGEGTRSTLLQFRAESNFTAEYDKILQGLIRGFAQQIYSTTDPQLRELQAVVQKYTPEQLYGIIYPVLPHFNELGTIVTAIDSKFQGTPDFSAGSLELNDLELSTTPYGVRGSGAVKLQPAHMPSGSMAVACNSCMQMIDDFVAYVGRIQNAVNYFDQSKAAMMAIDGRQVNAIKSFLNALIGPQKDAVNPTNLSFNIASDQASGITINGKTMNQVMALYVEYVMPAFKKPEADSGHGNLGIRLQH